MSVLEIVLLAMLVSALFWAGVHEVREGPWDSVEGVGFVFGAVAAATGVIWMPVVLVIALFVRFVARPLRLDAHWGADRDYRTERRQVRVLGPALATGTWHDHGRAEPNRFVLIGRGRAGFTLIRAGVAPGPPSPTRRIRPTSRASTDPNP